MPHLVERKVLSPLRTCFLNSDVSSVIGQNPRHERALVAFLVEHYGWTEGHDGTLYPATPHTTAGISA